MKPKETKVPRYVQKAVELAREKPLGSVMHVEVRHDADCPMLAGGKECLCYAEVREVKPS